MLLHHLKHLVLGDKWAVGWGCLRKCSKQTRGDTLCLLFYCQRIIIHFSQSNCYPAFFGDHPLSMQTTWYESTPPLHPSHHCHRDQSGTARHNDTTSAAVVVTNNHHLHHHHHHFLLPPSSSPQPQYMFSHPLSIRYCTMSTLP